MIDSGFEQRPRRSLTRVAQSECELVLTRDEDFVTSVIPVGHRRAQVEAHPRDLIRIGLVILQSK